MIFLSGCIHHYLLVPIIVTMQYSSAMLAKDTYLVYIVLILTFEIDFIRIFFPMDGWDFVSMSD